MDLLDSMYISKDVSNTSVMEALLRGLQYLVAHQKIDGHWEEYLLPVGRSDAWVTGYLGYTIAEAAPYVRGGFFLPAAIHAVTWLTLHRSSHAGWGYNAITPPDADSTAWALRLLREVNLDVPESDTAFLLSKKCADGGFSTYDGPGAWGIAHPDVTPNVYMALSQSEQALVRGRLLSYVEKSRFMDGTWPSYWWRTCHYSTFLNAELLSQLDMEDAHDLPIVRANETHAVHSNFDLACITAIAALRDRTATIATALVQHLVSQQRRNGSWHGGDDLRITDCECATPWLESKGRYYAEISGLITTATAVRALVLAIKRNCR